jgi:hypothetical protein
VLICSTQSKKELDLDANENLILEKDAIPPKDIFVIAYSKGMPDLLVLLAKRPDLKKRIRCIFNWAGAPGGSYLADSLYDSIKDINFNIQRRICYSTKINFSHHSSPS